MEEGPTNGTTRIPARWHSAAISVGYAGNSGFGYESGIPAAEKRFQHGRKLLGTGVFVALHEGQLLYRAPHPSAPEETAGRTYILHDEIVEGLHYRAVRLRKDVVIRPYRARYHIKFSVRGHSPLHSNTGTRSPYSPPRHAVRRGRQVPFYSFR